MNGSWEILFQWKLKWPIVIVFGLLLCILTISCVLLINLVLQKNRKKSWESLMLKADNDLLKKLENSESNSSIRNNNALYTFNLDNDLQGTITSRALRKWIILKRISTILLIFSFIIATFLIARPSKIYDAKEQASTRDIVLCLDVSGSALPYDQEVLQSYLTFVQHFQGERIGLSIFNSTSRTVFPLTDDYSLVKKQLQYASKLLDGVQTQDKIDNMQQKQYQQISTWLDGTQNRKEATSLIGDGLVSCAAMIPGVVYGSSNNSKKPHNRLNRSASIVLATDNVVSGKPSYSLKAALDLTKQANIQVDGLYSGSAQSENEATTRQMRDLITQNGGIFLTQHNADSVMALVRKIEQQHTSIPNDSSQSALSDDPSIATILAVIFVSLWLIFARRIKR